MEGGPKDHRTTTDEPTVHRGYGALRHGRYSVGGADYFLTGCLRRPLTGLTGATVAPLVQAKLHELETAGHWRVRTSVLMPDHFHLLITLGPNADLSEATRLFKGPLTPLLRHHGLHWQKNFCDHRLRSEDEFLPTFLYIFLNPYRAALIEPGQNGRGIIAHRKIGPGSAA